MLEIKGLTKTYGSGDRQHRKCQLDDLERLASPE
jgi:hypothetical protein